MGGGSPFRLPCTCCFYAEGSSDASFESELFPSMALGIHSTQDKKSGNSSCSWVVLFPAKS